MFTVGVGLALLGCLMFLWMMFDDESEMGGAGFFGVTAIVFGVLLIAFSAPRDPNYKTNRQLADDGDRSAQRTECNSTWVGTYNNCLATRYPTHPDLHGGVEPTPEPE